MTRTHWLILLAGIWSTLYAASFLLAAQTAPTGDGFTRGMNRLTLFVQYQFGAGLVAVVIWAMGQRLRHRWQRWLARVPGLLAVGLVLLVIGLIAVANLGISGSAPQPPDRPLTQPTAAPRVSTGHNPRGSGKGGTASLA